VLDYPYETVSAALKDPASWCDVMILPFNTKYCHPAAGPQGPLLQMRIGRKADQPADQAFPIEFSWRSIASGRDYFETRLDAASGPFGTHDYHISLSATPLDSGHTFLHMSYSYGSGGVGRLAMRAYLSTTGANKVGFTVVGQEANGQPQYIKGMRGVIERNVMRYYLAIDAHLKALSVPPPQRLDRRIQTWFDETERYARQLHEMDRSTYVAMKRSEAERQQTVVQ
jgi:hypothetical protein